MKIEECKKALRAKGIDVDNLSLPTIQYICEAFENIELPTPPKIKSVDPSERVKAGIQQLDAYVSEGNTGAIFDLLSDAIEMIATKPSGSEVAPSEEGQQTNQGD